MTRQNSSGFTLVELSIVLVIIGLIVSGILVGEDMIAAAKLRSQISQTDKMNTAVHTFQNKYNCMAGDCTPAQAAAFGFFTRAGTPGNGDGDGVVGCYTGVSNCFSQGGENHFFWTDLFAANLIPGSFTDSTQGGLTAATQAQVDALVPRASIGNANSVLVVALFALGVPSPGNYYLIQPVLNFAAGSPSYANGITPIDAQSIDTKIDDGLPFTGRVISTVGAGALLFVFFDPGGFCTLAGGTNAYNTSDPAHMSAVNCGLAISFQ